jgi:hypothetical protein
MDFIPELTEDETEAAMKAAAADLRFLMDKEEVPRVAQAALFHLGLTSSARYASAVKDAEDMKTFVNQALNVDFSANIPSRLLVTKLIVVWKQASVRVDKKAEADAEADASRMRKTLEVTDFQAMRSGFFTRWWELDEGLIPSRFYLEKKLEDLESNEPRAELLTAVVSYNEEDQEAVAPVYDKNAGTFKFKRDSCQVPLPNNPEQLRRRIKILGHAHMFLGLKFTNREWIQGLTPQVFEDYLTYLLGEHVYGMTAKDHEGRIVSSPAWHHVLGYELAIRKGMVRLITHKNKTMKAALEEACKDSTIKERFFTTPVAHAALHSPEAREERPAKVLRTEDKGGGKGGGKGDRSGGKGGEKGTGKKQKCPAASPSGEKICFRFNSKKCKTKACAFAHICGTCFQKGHPMGSDKCKGPSNVPGGETRTAA